MHGLYSNFDECESFIESNTPDILALCKTNLDDSIDSANFPVSGCLPLIRKESVTHMHGLAVYVKEGRPFAQDLSLENSEDSYFGDIKFGSPNSIIVVQKNNNMYFKMFFLLIFTV